jgi:hypothetical protein
VTLYTRAVCRFTGRPMYTNHENVSLERPEEEVYHLQH